MAPKGAGSSPVGHPLTQVGTQRIITFCEDCEYSYWHLGEKRTQGSLRCYSVLLGEARRTSRQWPTPQQALSPFFSPT